MVPTNLPTEEWRPCGHSDQGGLVVSSEGVGLGRHRQRRRGTDLQNMWTTGPFATTNLFFISPLKSHNMAKHWQAGKNSYTI